MMIKTPEHKEVYFISISLLYVYLGRLQDTKKHMDGFTKKLEVLVEVDDELLMKVVMESVSNFMSSHY